MATNTQLKNMLTLESEPGPFISLFMPTELAMDKKRVKDMFKKIKDAFYHQYPKKSWDPYQEKLNHFQTPRLLNHKITRGFAIYIGPTILKVFKLTRPTKLSCYIDDTMKIIPLVLDVQFKHILHSNLLYDNAIKNIRAHYQLANTGKHTSTLLKDIVDIAPSGQIDTLLINQSAGDNTINHVLNDLAITTIGFGGRVFVLSSKDMPVNDGVAIISRL